MRRARIAGLAAGALMLLTHGVFARTVRDEPYPLETTWNAAVRLVRVDMGMPIVERDEGLGYFTFTYREGGRTVPGSMELVRTEIDGRPGARIIVQIPAMPTYVESMLLTRLTRKLHSEFGEPPPAVRRAPPAAPAPPGEGAHPPDAPGTPASPGAPVVPSAPVPDPPAVNRRDHIDPAGPETRRPSQSNPSSDDD